MNEKLCLKCGQLKSADLFHKCTKSKTGLTTYCKECRKKTIIKIINKNYCLESENLNSTDKKMIDYLKKYDPEALFERAIYCKMKGWQTDKYQIFNEFGVFLIFEKDAFCYETGRTVKRKHIYTKYS